MQRARITTARPRKSVELFQMVFEAVEVLEDGGWIVEGDSRLDL